VSRGSWDGISQPDPDRRDVDGALVHELALVVPGGDGAELLELGEAALDGVALFVASGVEGGRAAARAAAAAAVLLLVFLHRDDRGDPALAQPGAVSSGGVGLVGQRGAGPGAGPSRAPAADADGLHQRDELRAVAVLARAEDPADRAAAPVRGQVDLGAQPAAGAAQRLSARPRRVLVIRRRPL